MEGIQDVDEGQDNGRGGDPNSSIGDHTGKGTGEGRVKIGWRVVIQKVVLALVGHEGHSINLRGAREQ